MCEYEKVDKEHLLTIFPSEIWLNILNQAASGDIYHILRYSPEFFKKLIFPFRTNLLFAAVLPSLLNYLPRDTSTRKLLFTCRLACVSWSKSVKHVVQQKVQTYTEDKELESVSIPRFLRSFCDFFMDSESVGKFMNQFEITHINHRKNPFVSRRITVSQYYFCEENEVQEYFKELDKLLLKCGQHVWHCRLEGLFTHMQIQKILNSLQNLKTLTAKFLSPVWLTDDLPEILPPFPKYSNLECLKVTGLDNHNLFQAMLINNSHVRILEKMCGKYQMDETFYLENMPNLNKLKLRFDSIAEFERLDSLVSAWPLKRLCVDMKMITGFVTWRVMERCFEILEGKFRGTLESLEIIFPSGMDESNPPSCTLRLPKLTSLSLIMEGGLLLDFIVPLKNLKFLNVEATKRVPRNLNESVIKFYSIESNLKHSNIWGMLPKLEEVTVWCLILHQPKRTYKRNTTTGNIR